MKKRVLVRGASKIGKAGVATIVYKWGQKFNQDVLVYDYLMQSGLPDEEYQVEILKKSSKMFTLNTNKKDVFNIFGWIKKIIEQEKYDTIHINTDTAYMAAFYIYVSERAGIKNIYVHSHCSQIDDLNKVRRTLKIIAHYMFRKYVSKHTKMYLACSRVAGEWMFGKENVNTNKYRTIYNGVEVEKYLYNSEIRELYRKQLSLSNKYVIGCIGRFSYQKNHDFLLDIFHKLQQSDENALLLLIGEGELEDKLREKVELLRIGKKVKFLGVRDDVPKLLSAMDILVMPSRFEGLPVTMVEAQMASLPCVVSENITKEAKFTDDVTYVNGYNVDDWVGAIKNYQQIDIKRENNGDKLRESKFNINNATIDLQNILIGE